MRLIKDNVERIADTPERIAKLKAKRFEEMSEHSAEPEEMGLESKTVRQLRELAKAKGLEGYAALGKESLLALLKDVSADD